jgi:CheY-like chemotaxis protein/HPt (histidine-containing phosphotransfer) domain-containing protein
MDGFELARKLQEMPSCRTATILMLSSAAEPNDVERCKDLGIAAYLRKPIKYSELKRTIIAALEQSPSQIGPAESGAGGGPHKPLGLRVLLAEDNLINQKVALRLLEKLGCSVVVAANGKEALAAFEKQPFDLVLSDVQMPEMGGFEFTAEVRSREKDAGRSTPIMAMTAHAMAGDREKCLEAGMDSYVSKPINERELRHAIERLLRSEPPASVSSPFQSGVGNFKPGAALDWLGGESDILNDLIETFLSEYGGVMEKIRQAIAECDPRKLERGSHLLKGMVVYFGEDSVVDAAQSLEMIGAEKRLAEAPGSMALLESEVARLAGELAAYRASVTA